MSPVMELSHLCLSPICLVLVFSNLLDLVKSNTTIIETGTDPSFGKETVVYSTNETEPNPQWLIDALKDIAYYLRYHKFNEYDRRYESNESLASRTYYKTFPKPPLRSLHWEVNKACDVSFIDCVKYLIEKIESTDSRRIDDTITVMEEQKWTKENNLEQIKSFDETCRKAKRRDDLFANPFQGPLERYQWRVSASYYMCWFTMKEVKSLQHLSEACDNFANCFDPSFGANNLDLRADDQEPFSCAIYSFCPDPCCPFKHMTKQEKCWNSDNNPCFSGNPEGERECLLDRSQNGDFRDIILNRWNVTCKCPKSGFEWNSLYGMCIDVDECAIGSDNCNSKLETCVNLPGNFRCVCKWGHFWNEEISRCEPSPALATIRVLSRGNSSRDSVEEEESFLDKFRKWFRKYFMKPKIE